MSSHATCPTTQIFSPRTAPKLRLFCFHHAGAGASSYRAWPQLVGDEIELCALQLPGREARLREPLHRDLDSAVDEITTAMRSLVDRPFALFGHSMGALVAFEVARQARARFGVTPMHLFVSGRRAPAAPHCGPRFHRLPVPDMLRALDQRYGGVPRAVLEDEDLMALFAPILQADFCLLETYEYRPAPPLTCPVTALGGADDSLGTPADLAAWQRETSGVFVQHTLPGGHFFVQSEQARVAEIVRDALSTRKAGLE